MIQYLLFTSSIAQMKLSSYANVFKLFLFCSQRMATHHFSWSQIVSWTNLCDKTHFTKQWNHKMERQRLSKDVHPDHSSFFCQWVGLKLDTYLILAMTKFSRLVYVSMIMGYWCSLEYKNYKNSSSWTLPNNWHNNGRKSFSIS